MTYEPWVSDFGLVWSTAEGKDSFTAEKSAGTNGYLPPEYIMTGRVTRKLDFYSFRVILKELLTGQKAVDKRRSEDPHISLWFINLVKEDSFENVIEETIQITEENRGSISEVAKLASYCCAKTPEKRPDMSYAVTVLALLTEQWKPSKVEETRDAFLEEFGKKWWHEQQRLEGISGPSSLRDSKPTVDASFEAGEYDSPALMFCCFLILILICGSRRRS